MIDIKTFVFNPFHVNTYLISGQNGSGFIIDAACSEEKEIKELLYYIKSKNIKIKALINTHCHVDHVLGVEFLREHFNAEFLCSEKEQFLLDNAEAHGDFFGLPVEKPSRPDRYISEKDDLFLGNTKIEILHIPGHSPGSLAFYLKDEMKLFSGDVLFSGSIGRTDLPGGDYTTLVEGIKKSLLVLRDDVEVYPGHGPSTTIGNEKFLNPFLQ